MFLRRPPTFIILLFNIGFNVTNLLFWLTCLDSCLNISFCINLIITSCVFFICSATTVKPLYTGHLRLLKKVSAMRRCPLHRVFDFFEEKYHNRVVVTGKR